MNTDLLFCHIRCLSDGKLTGAKSYFLQRSREDKLHFQLKAFGFHKDQKNSVSTACTRCICRVEKKNLASYHYKEMNVNAAAPAEVLQHFSSFFLIKLLGMFKPKVTRANVEKLQLHSVMQK